MSLEHHHAEVVPGRLADHGDPGAAGLGENWGWLLVQLDWSLRQRAPRPDRVVTELRRRVAVAAAWLRRLIRGAVQDTARVAAAAGTASAAGTAAASATAAASDPKSDDLCF